MIVARRYARALFDEAERQSRTAFVDEDVTFIQASLESSRDLVNFFRSPIISRQRKGGIVQALFEQKVDRLTLDFLLLLVDNDREDMLPDVLSAYHRMRDEHEGVVDATARVARAMSDAEREKLVGALEALTGKTVRLELKEQSELIGGVVIRVGDMVYDGSIRHQLERLRDRMEEGSYLLN